MTMRAIWNGAVLAQSDDTVVVEGNHYFPMDSVSKEYLRPSDTRSVCPWKGKASYYSVNVDGATNPDAAWEYQKPSPLARRIKGRIAFWRGIEITSDGSSTDRTAAR
jgi:uncharacterized protein (DUF427 family)